MSRKRIVLILIVLGVIVIGVCSVVNRGGEESVSTAPTQVPSVVPATAVAAKAAPAPGPVSAVVQAPTAVPAPVPASVPLAPAPSTPVPAVVQLLQPKPQVTAGVQSSGPLEVVTPPLAEGFTDDFEELDAGGSSYTLYRVGSFGEWEVERGSIDHVGSWQADSGTQSVDLNGSGQAGTISRSIQTKSGQLYWLSFAMSVNPEGGPATRRMEVWVGPVLIDTPSSSSAGKSPQNMQWERHNYFFVVNGNPDRVRFRSLERGSFGPALDSVSLVPIDAVPTPTPVASVELVAAFTSTPTPTPTPPPTPTATPTVVETSTPVSTVTPTETPTVVEGTSTPVSVTPTVTPDTIRGFGLVLIEATAEKKLWPGADPLLYKVFVESGLEVMERAVEVEFAPNRRETKSIAVELTRCDDDLDDLEEPIPIQEGKVFEVPKGGTIVCVELSVFPGTGPMSPVDVFAELQVKEPKRKPVPVGSVRLVEDLTIPESLHPTLTFDHFDGQAGKLVFYGEIKNTAPADQTIKSLRANCEFPTLEVRVFLEGEPISSSEEIVIRRDRAVFPSVDAVPIGVVENPSCSLIFRRIP